MSLPSTQVNSQHAGMAWYGLHPATVVALQGDPTSAQRIEVELPWLPNATATAAVRAWAEVVTPYGDADQGFMMLPEVGSTVVVGFWWGDVDHPYVIGATWNGNAAMPESPSDDNHLRLIASRSGSRLQFDDTPGGVKVQISSEGAPGGSVNTITLDAADQSITIATPTGATVTLNGSGGIEITAASTVQVSAASVTVDAAMSTFNGIVKCDTLIASSGVVSPSYTPGAGNVW